MKVYVADQTDKAWLLAQSSKQKGKKRKRFWIPKSLIKLGKSQEGTLFDYYNVTIPKWMEIKYI